MNIVSMEDIEFLARQSSTKINMVLAGMTALMSDTDNKVAALESQDWFQRMIKSVTGKNRLTQLEIEKNHDKLSCYMAEAVAELYERNCITNEVMLSLGTQINEIYADNFQIRRIMKAFVEKLNAKIDSVDNFHLLQEEIAQGRYTQNSHLIAICKVMSQLDYRILDDGRKLDVLKGSLTHQGILNDEPIKLKDYLNYVLRIPFEDVGQIYLELGTIRYNIIVKLLLKTMENYHFLPDMEKKLKDTTVLVENVIRSEGLDDNVTLSINDIYDSLIKSKIDIRSNLVSAHDDVSWTPPVDEVTQGQNAHEEVKREAKSCRRALTEAEITSITVKYGYNVKSKKSNEDDKAYGIPEGRMIYTEYTWPGFTCMGLCFCDDGVYSWVGYFSTAHRFLSYDELRNKKEINIEWLRKNFMVFPDEVVMVLMELKEFE